MEDSPTILTNNDVLIRLMEFLGPRHVCIGFGATSKHLHQLSKCNSLWRLFWRARCRFTDMDEDKSFQGNGNMNMADVHKAAMVFRHAIHEMGLADKMMLYTRCTSNVHCPSQDNEEEEQMQPTDENILYLAYIQKHSAMKLTNLRVEPFGRQLKSNHQLEQSKLQSPLCTQAWPGQLSLVVNDMIGGARNTVTCLNSAESWCDYPNCTQARCGPQGCLRCYRFLPRDYALSAGGQLSAARECSERSYDYYTFVKCSWCSVSFCNEHVDKYFYYEGAQDNKLGRRSWYKCDECQLQSCPDCVSQIFASPPNMNGCNVVTAGKQCRRKVCTDCIWYVGKEKQSIVQNIPGGSYPPSEACDIVSIKGQNTVCERGIMEWQEVETCCSKCLRHVEFRLKELEQVRESFGGLIP